MKIGRLKKLLYIGLFLGILNLVNGQMPLEDFFLSASFEQFDPNTEFPKNRITNLTEDPFGYIWIGTNQSGLYQYNGYEIKQFNANYKNPKSYPDVHVWNVLIARDSTIWFCHEKGFSTFNYDTQSFLNASEILDIDFDKGNQIGHSIFELNDSILIFGMTDGIWFFNRNQKAITKKTLQNNLPWPDYNAILQMTRNPNKPTELLIRSTRGIYLYNLLNDSEEFHAFHNGKITYLEHTPDVFVNNKLIFPGNGRLSLMEFDILKKESRVILKDTIQNSAGVFNMAYNWFQLLADSSILISTSKHEMLIYDPFNETSRKLKFGDKFKYGANPYLFDSNGYFWFSRDWDLFKSDTPFLPFKKHKAKAPHLHAMFINGNPVSFDRIQKKPLILKEFEKNIEFQVGKINPNPSDATKYEYQLKGESNKWQSFQNNQINLQDLGGGEYSLKIAQIETNNRTEFDLLNFKKEKTLLENNWFWLFLIVCIGSIFFAYNRIRVNNVRKEERLKASYEKKLSELQLEALQSQMNPHFIFNALNSIKHFILTNEKFKAAEYLSGFSSLVRQVLNNSKSPTINLEKEIETLRLYINMEQMRFDKFEYQIHVDASLDLLDINLPPLIFQPYVENAIWHGLMHKEGNGKLIISFTKDKENLQCIIDDNGIGRQRAMETAMNGVQKRKSFGMQITRDRMRINQLAADIQIVDKKNEGQKSLGTKVIINIPLTQENNKT